MAWTDERIDQLKSMWEKGMTASQIADELGGVSRNAVIGKAHRLGLQSRPSPVKAGDAPRKPAPPKRPAPKKPDAQAEPAPVESSRPAVPPSVPQHPSAAVQPSAPDTPPQPRIVSVGPGGFLRQWPGDQQAPIPPAPPRRLVPA